MNYDFLFHLPSQNLRISIVLFREKKEQLGASDASWLESRLSQIVSKLSVLRQLFTYPIVMHLFRNLIDFNYLCCIQSNVSPFVSLCSFCVDKLELNFQVIMLD